MRIWWRFWPRRLGCPRVRWVWSAASWTGKSECGFARRRSCRICLILCRVRF